MYGTSKKIAAAGLAALVVGGGAGGALAASGSGSVGSPPPLATSSGPPGGGPLEGAATYLGLTVQQVRDALGGGASLANLAGQQGKSVAGLEQAIVADAKTHLDAAVAAGNLTAAKEQELLSRLQSHVDELVNRTGLPARGPGRAGGRGDLLAGAATYLGLTQDEIRAKLAAGSSLADLAKAQGKTEDGLVAAILSGAKTRLDGAVQAGRLTAADESRILDGLKARAVAIVERAGLAGPPGRHP
jgi:hypothetical protein